MRFGIGILAVFLSIVISCLIGGIHFGALFQPTEMMVIFGAMAGAYIIGNPAHVLRHTVSALQMSVSGAVHGKKEYLELLSMLFVVFKLARNKGVVALESHIDDPAKSTLFQKFPHFTRQKPAVGFVCDYLRLITMGGTTPAQIEYAMGEELDSLHSSESEVVTALKNAADGLPALGIVAAVLGVIHTMGSISQPPEVIGMLIAGALVGTLMGVLLAYGIVGPIASCVKNVIDTDAKYMAAIKAGMVSYMNGNPPLIAVEYARKMIDGNLRPSFTELEKMTGEADGITIDAS